MILRTTSRMETFTRCSSKEWGEEGIGWRASDGPDDPDGLDGVLTTGTKDVDNWVQCYIHIDV